MPPSPTLTVCVAPAATVDTGLLVELVGGVIIGGVDVVLGGVVDDPDIDDSEDSPPDVCGCDDVPGTACPMVDVTVAVAGPESPFKTYV